MVMIMTIFIAKLVQYMKLTSHFISYKVIFNGLYASSLSETDIILLSVVTVKTIRQSWGYCTVCRQRVSSSTCVYGLSVCQDIAIRILSRSCHLTSWPGLPLPPPLPQLRQISQHYSTLLCSPLLTILN